ncbi:cation transporter [Methanoplanus sp. FWC-SCC4]|uniref:Cation transporter n=1 Tax=Methanochimaera problematica TaxID=2609417 RepID=A0AA97FCT0_9EURY|nr:cation diffusion facilitator family transporter [Methanoplanus sp. FWC-SCC4]WOF16157.1 cation transporter [Methanoplanus sp. FWC-SCC4]
MPAKENSEKRAEENIRLAFFLNLIFTIIEFIGGFYTGSLAIIADAVHDMGDSFSLGLSWIFEHIAKEGRTERYSYGLKRLSLLSALINAVVLIIGSVFILSQAIPRLFVPGEPNAAGMFILAIFGVIINGAAAYRVYGGKSLNEKLVTWHLLEDFFGWMAVLIVSTIMYFWNLPVLDPILSIIITIFIFYNVVRNLKEVLVIFLQGVPREVSVTEVESALNNIQDITDVHDIHIWSLDGEHHIITLHVVIDKNCTFNDINRIKCSVKRTAKRLGIDHATIEIEKEGELCEMTEDEEY